MQDEFETFVWALLLSLLAGVVLFVLRIAAAWYLRHRLPAGLVPQGDELMQPDATSRLVSLLGHAAAPAETLGEMRLRATLGLRLLHWAVFLVMAVTVYTMQAPLIGIETAILALVFYLSVHISLYEIRYDRDTITLPRWWFGHTTRRWRDLDAAFERRGWFLILAFRDGLSVQVHKYVVGYAALRKKADAAAREV